MKFSISSNSYGAYLRCIRIHRYIDGFIYLFIASLVIICFYPSFDNEFVQWDDQYYITDNIYINQPSIEHLRILMTKVISLNYHPITMISLWINSYFSGVECATPYIVTNVLIHLCSALLLFRLCKTIFDGDRFHALMVSLIFAVHPMHVESVVWVSERKDVFYAFFFICSLLYWCQYQDKENRTAYVLSLIFFILSCLSKAMAVSLVPVLFLIDMYKGHRWNTKLLLLKIPFLIIGIVVGLIAINVQQGGDFYGLLSNTNIDVAINSVNVVSLYSQISNVGFGIYHYISSFIFPDNMSAFHPYSVVENHSLKELFFFVPFLVLGVLLVSYRLSKRIFFGIGFFISTVILVLQWIPVGSAIVADRYTYLPYIGLAIMILPFMQLLQKKISPFFWYLALSSFIIFLSIKTYDQSDIWQNHVTLFSQSVEKYPEDPKSRMLLATGLWTSGNHHQAIEHIEHAINELGLFTSDSFEKLANCYEEIGESEKALAFYNQSIKLDPNNYIARYHRAIAVMHKNPKLAIDDLTVAESSGFEFIKNNIYGPRGVCYGMIGEYNLAIEDFTKAIDLGIDLKNNYRDRAITYEKMGLMEKARIDRIRFDEL